jgi:hypothetical protein
MKTPAGSTFSSTLLRAVASRRRGRRIRFMDTLRRERLPVPRPT